MSEEGVKQLVTYHTCDGKDWPISMDVEQAARALEEFHGHGIGEDWQPPTDSYILSYSNGHMVHLRAENVTALEVENLEDLINARSRAGQPPAKSRRTPT